VLNRLVGFVSESEDGFSGIQNIAVDVEGQGTRKAINYPSLTGPVEVGDFVLLNETARLLSLGTGGYDFVIANLSDPTRRIEDQEPSQGHIIKGRYLPHQQAVLTLEEQPEFADVWEQSLDGLPVIVGQLHSQIAAAAAGLALRKIAPVAYIMTDAAALPLALSRLVVQLREAGLIQSTFTSGQAFGGDYETVTVHSALLAAKHLVGARAVIVCQGPGNAGTGTRYGFSGLEQASLLDTAERLGGKPFAIVRASEADSRERHRGISHHSRTALSLTYANCFVGLPEGVPFPGLDPRHQLRNVEGDELALRLLKDRSIDVTTMGRSVHQDPIFFKAAAAAGIAAADELQLQKEQETQ